MPWVCLHAKWKNNWVQNTHLCVFVDNGEKHGIKGYCLYDYISQWFFMIMNVIFDENVLFLAKSIEIFKPPQPSQEHVP
jgi:hypothetical protein